MAINYWIFNVKKDENRKYSRKGIEIYNHRMCKDHFWGIKEFTKSGRRTPNVTYLKREDNVLFYLVGEEGHCFLGTCVLDSSFRQLTNEEVKQLTHEEFLDWNQGVFLKDIEKWQKPLPIESLRGKVSFVPISQHYGSYLQGSIKKISEFNYNTIIHEHISQYQR
jgi:hypothetical protein